MIILKMAHIILPFASEVFAHFAILSAEVISFKSAEPWLFSCQNGAGMTIAPSDLTWRRLAASAFILFGRQAVHDYQMMRPYTKR